VFLLYGEQSAADREAALRSLNPASQTRPVGVVGNPLAGGAAVNLAGASLAITMSQDTKLRVYLQKRGRIRRPGQTKPVTYVDVLACGPKGQRTIDHHIAAALRGKQDIASYTTATWRRLLTEE
jgi:superfamily II DNA or RNA helicase